MSVRVALLVTVAAIAFASSTSPAAATGGLYNVVKCHALHTEADEINQVGSHPSYETVDDCDGNSPDRKIGIYNTGAAGNSAYTQFAITAPAGTHFESVCLDHRLRRDSHHVAEILVFPGFQVLAAGGDQPDGWTNGCFDINHAQLIVRLACSQAGGCPAGPNAHAYVRNVVLAVADDIDPTITAFGGDLLEGGWIRGIEESGGGCFRRGSGGVPARSFMRTAPRSVAVRRTATRTASSGTSHLG